jgi:hypothetical protein
VDTVIGLLAENNFGDTRAGSLAGPTGLVVILLLIIGTVLLIRNMNARLRRLPASFEQEENQKDETITPRSPVPFDASGEDKDAK